MCVGKKYANNLEEDSSLPVCIGVIKYNCQGPEERSIKDRIKKDINKINLVLSSAAKVS